MLPKNSNPAQVLCIMPVHPWTVGDIRLVKPLERLESKYPGLYEFNFKSVVNLNVQDVNNANIVIIQRIATAFLMRLMRLLKGAVPVIFEIDDLLFDMPDFLNAASINKRNAANLKIMISDADYVTTTTTILAEHLAKLNPEVRIIPNCIDFSNPPEYRQFGSGAVNLIFSSTDTVSVDVLIPVIKRLQRENRETEFHVYGPNFSKFAASGIKLIPHPSTDYGEFHQQLAGHKNPVALIPLDDSNFSNCKSPVKYLDYTAAGIPVIASNVPPYREIITPGQDGILAENNPEAWYDAIVRVLDNADFCLSLAKNAYEKHRKNYSLGASAEKWHELFEKILSVHPLDNPKIKRLPASFSLRHLHSILSPERCVKFVRLIKKHGITHIFQIIRKTSIL